MNTSNYSGLRRAFALGSALLGVLITCSVQAHIIGDAAHDEGEVANYDFSVRPPTAIKLTPGTVLMAQAAPPARTATAQRVPTNLSLMRSSFQAFAPAVKTRDDGRYFYVESDAMPDHQMMVGITAWQQQVPLPQQYVGGNAWQIPLNPVAAKNPLSAKSHFFRGAIALAANGVPIFNPIKNDGHTDTFLAGELDEFGGHCGRADDYHYHIAPVHLQQAVGANNPIAFALDGYAIFGLTEPDGSVVGKLDEFNGHSTPPLGYHYHATKAYPYLNGGFHGEVTEAGGQVDPQPRAQSVRPALPPLRGARITGFAVKDKKQYSVKLQVGSETQYVNYTLNENGTVKFDYVDGRGQVRSETYSPRRGGGPGGPSPDERKGKKGEGKGGERPPGGKGEAKGGDPNRQPWMKVHAKEMDADKDGTLTREELIAEVKKVFQGYDHNHDGKLSSEEYAGQGGVRSAMGGFVKQHASELDMDNDGFITLKEMQATAARMFDKTDVNHDGRLSPEETALPPGYVATPPEQPVRKP